MQSRNISSISSIIQRIFLQNFLNQKSLKTNTLLPFQKKKQKKKKTKNHPSQNNFYQRIDHRYNSLIKQHRVEQPFD